MPLSYCNIVSLYVVNLSRLNATGFSCVSLWNVSSLFIAYKFYRILRKWLKVALRVGGAVVQLVSD